MQSLGNLWGNNKIKLNNMKAIVPRQSNIHQHPLQQWGRYITLSVGVTGILVLLGWLFNIELFKRPIPGLVAMNPLTAICFVLASVALFLLTLPGKTRQQKKSAIFITCIILVLSTIKLVAIISGVDPHIDSILFHNRLEKDIVGNISNRMAPNTALAFFLTAIAFLLLNKQDKKKRMPSQSIALLISMVGMLSFLGYIYRVQAFYGILSYIPMAIHTAVCFLLLALAILFANPKKGLMAEFTGTEAAATTSAILIPAAIIIPQLLGFFRLYSAWEGILSLEFGAALLILCNMMIFLILIWLSLRALNRKDALRKAAEEQLYETNKELEAFTYSVSHDLRAPIRAIQGYTQMLNEDYGTLLDEEGKRIIDVVKYNTTKMGRLIDDLLAFSHLGRKELQKTKIDMTLLTAGVLAEIDKSTSHHPKILTADLHSVKGDYTLLHQVMFNLISNAVKYSSKKTDAVVQIASEEKEHEIIFSVKDNGAGFDMKYANKLFGVFQRLHEQNEFEGTGIGLAIIYRIITKHGGRVWAEGKMEEGASFYFSLPKN